MIPIGLVKRRLVRASALGAAVFLVGCGGGGEDVESSTATTAQATAAAPSTVPVVTTTVASSPTTGGRSTVPTTTLPSRADADITMDFIPEHTMYNSPSFRPLEINGVSYVNALRMYSQKTASKLEINAGRSRTFFRGSLGIPDDQNSSSSHQVEISFDNAAPAYSAVVNFGETKEIDLDVTGVLRIRVTVSSLVNSSGYLAIGNPRFAET